MTGIYKIESSLFSNRFYIGSAINIKNRKYEHLSDLKLNKHCNKKLQNHFNKYGNGDFIFIILELCFPEFLTAREQYYINKLKPYFNICKIAGNSLGRKASKETRQKLSESHKGIRLSEEAKNKLSEINKEKIFSIETRGKISEAKKGNKNTLGKHWKLSEEIRNKMSESQKGRKHTERTKMKMSIAQKGRKHTEEAKKKISIARNKMEADKQLKIT